MPDPPLSPAARSYLNALDTMLSEHRGSPAWLELTERVAAGVLSCEVRTCAADGCDEQFVVSATGPRPGRPRLFCRPLCRQRTNTAQRRAA